MKPLRKRVGVSLILLGVLLNPLTLPLVFEILAGQSQSISPSNWIYVFLAEGYLVCLGVAVGGLGGRLSWLPEGISVAGTALLLVAISADAGLQYLGSRMIHQEPHPIYHHGYRPNDEGLASNPTGERIDPVHIKTNSLGMRGPEPSPPAGRTRVLLLGDSFIQADELPLEQALGAVLSEQLGSDFYVMSHGMASWSPIIQLAWLQHAFESLRPDVVYLFLCINDFWALETQYGDAYYATQARLDEQGFPVGFDVDTTPLGDTRLYRLTLPGLRSLIAESLNGLRNGPPPPTTLTSDVMDTLLAAEPTELEPLLLRHVPEADLADLTREMVRLSRPPAQWNSRTRADVDRTLGFVALMHDFLAGMGVELVLSYAPFGWSVAPDETVPGKAFFGLAADAMLPSNGIEERIRSFAEDRVLPYLDLVEPLTAAALASSQPIYFPMDGHWTAVGQRVVGAELLKSVAALQPLEQPSLVGGDQSNP